MRLLRVHIVRAQTCGGLLDGFDGNFHSSRDGHQGFEPLCLIGPNGSGKSQLLQIIAEIFQSIFAYCVPLEEREDGNPGLLFEIDYLIWPTSDPKPSFMRASRMEGGRLSIQRKIRLEEMDQWIECDPEAKETQALIPWRVIGYTSGHNETLSLPFLQSRSMYAEEVRNSAFSSAAILVPETRLMLIDYGTHLEVLVANLLLGSEDLRRALLSKARVEDLHSFRCKIQLGHRAAPEVRTGPNKEKGIQLTEELKQHIENLICCSTSYDYDRAKRTYTIDFLVDDSTRQAFLHYWPNGALSLYSSFHKLAMLNDLVLPRKTRKGLNPSQKARRFASRLPEPPDEHKVFCFERVKFSSLCERGNVDYVSLSDGEHQLMQILCTVSMLMRPNVVLLLDEPESHFNPQWRVEFISMLKNLPGGEEGLRLQDCLLTTHAPFVASDMPRERVLIFSKTSAGTIAMRRPAIETYGSTFDTILGECFGVSPPISEISRREIESLMDSADIDQVREGIQHLGHSVEKAFLADHLRLLQKASKD